MVRQSEWKQAVQNQHVLIPQLNIHINLLEQRVIELEGALDRATTKYTDRLDLERGHLEDDTSPCTLIVAGLMFIAATWASWHV